MAFYKAFQKGMICRGKQYQENTVYEEVGADGCCKEGMMHFCESPLDTLNYYQLIDANGELSEFATVEPLDEIKREKDKCACRKIKIGAKLSLKGFIEAAVSVLIEKTKCSGETAASGDYSQLAASGDYSKLAASGYSSKLAASGYSSQLAASGYSSKLAASGGYSKLAASGDYSQLAASGDSSRLAASGDSSKLAASGDYSKLAMNGKNSVGANIGFNGKAKGALGCWIVLAEWIRIDKDWTPVCVKAGKIDGEALKPDTWYILEDGEFKEV